MSVRIRVSDFAPTKSQKRIMKKNAHLERTLSTPWVTEPQFDLFQRYLNARHADGSMANMDILEFAAMVEETPIRSTVLEYHTGPSRHSDDLAAVCLTDILQDGLSMVYSFFNPDLEKSSLGSFMILDHIEIAREAGLPYVYLGYWVPGSQKMAYKAKFRPLEVFRKETWSELADPKDFELDKQPLSTKPIPEQIANIRLPHAKRRPA